MKGTIPIVRANLNWFILKSLWLPIFICSFTSCNDLESPGAIVPPTAEQDPNLPQATIQVAGFSRQIHLQTFGDSNNPVILILHGGPGADFRMLLPLSALSDSYYIVMWDSRGAGLSERVTRAELALSTFEDEVAEVKQIVAPNQKVILVGHSFGGNVLTQYTARHPNEVSQLILIEPGKLDLALSPNSNGGAVSFIDGQDLFWQNEILTSKDHAAADYKAIDLLPKSARNWTCNGSIITDYPIWRFGAYHYYQVQLNTFKLPDQFNWADGIANFKGQISIVAGTCGALNDDFQRKTNLITLPQATLVTVQGAGHITLFTEHSTATLSAIRTLLK